MISFGYSLFCYIPCLTSFENIQISYAWKRITNVNLGISSPKYYFIFFFVVAIAVDSDRFSYWNEKENLALDVQHK